MGRGLIAFLLFFVNLHSTAHAGVLLKLNAGSIDPTKLTSSQDSIFSSPSKNDRSSTNPQTPVSESKDQLISTEYILQFSKPITEFDKAQLKKYFKVFNYLPDDAMVVRGSWKQIQKYQSHHNTLRAAIQYAPSFKVSDEIWHLNVFNQNEFVAVIITLFSASEVAPIIKQIQNLDPQAALEDFHGRRLIFTLPRKRIPSIAGLTGVEHIEAVPQMELFDFSASENPRTSLSSEYSQLTGYEDGTRLMKFNAAWAQGFRGKNQIVAMADTGVDSGNTQNIIPDLQGAILQGQAFGQQSTSWADPMGHGTHIAGLLVGRGTASGGLIQGGANEAQLIAGSMWSPSERNMTVPAKLAVLFDGAYQAGARVHSNSWGSSKDFGAYDDSAAQVDEWMFNNPDMLIVFAAGNGAGDFNKDGRIDNNSLATPGTAKNALTVGASKNFILQGGEQGPIGHLPGGANLWPSEPLFSSSMSDNEKGLAPFSGRGPTKDGRLKPDLVAPGTNILGTKSHQPGASSLWGFFNKDYTWSGGTSMAAPLAASAATVARQILIEKWGVQNPSAALIKASLLHSAEDLFPGQFSENGAAQGQELLNRRPNFDEGYGRVNMENLVNLAGETQVIDNREGVAQDQRIVYQFEVRDEAKFYANLVWTDAPASANAAVALVNDLDLQLTFPDGRVLSSEDHVNNQESLEIDSLKPGIYQLAVRGFRVPAAPEGHQSFAFIYSVFEKKRGP